MTCWHKKRLTIGSEIDKGSGSNDTVRMVTKNVGAVCR